MASDSKRENWLTSTLSLPRMPPLEPGVIPIFRRIMVIAWALSSPGFCGALTAVEKTPGQYSFFALWFVSGGLYLYLSNRWGQKRYPRAHLALALISISVLPILIEHLANAVYLRHGGSLAGPLLNGTALYLWLILPLLLISTQYGMRSMLIFTVGTSLLSVVLALIWFRQWGIPVGPTIGNAFVRLIIFALTGFIVTRLTSSQRELRLEIAEKNRKIAEYASRLEDLAIARERNRMARELHDTLAHTLSAVEVQLKVLDMLIQRNPDDARKQVAEIRTLARSGLGEARRALNDLRAQPIEEFGLLLALRRLAERAAERTGAQGHVTLPREVQDLSIQQQQQLYRIVEEALNNMVRHARASHFWLTMEANAAYVRVTVEDNGVGFDASALPEARYGVAGMRERAELIQAQLHVKSTPGKGTSVVLLLGVGA